jgi:hypothetical protein
MYIRRLLFAASISLIAIAALGQNANMGARYHIIDSEVLSVTTRFHEIEITSARDGTKLITTIRNRQGRVLGQSVSEPVQIKLRPLSNAAADSVIINDRTLDFVNADAYVAWKHHEPRRGAYRPLSDEAMALVGGVAAGELGDAETDVRSVRMLTAIYEAFSLRTNPALIRENPQFPTFTVAVRDRRTNAVVANAGWHAAQRRFVMRVTGERSITVDAAALPHGWTFTPNEAWADIQLLSYLKGKATQSASRAASTAFHVQPLNDPGCDYLHWLDGTVLRQCCDMHDACYETDWPPCEAGKAWFFQDGWHCTQCNISVIECFVVEYFLDPILFPIYSWDPGPPMCDPAYPVCPAWCSSCGTLEDDW